MPAPPHLLPSRLREGPGEGEPAGSGARSRRRGRHRVDNSRPGRHSRPADAGRECRPLPTRPAGRHCRRQMPTARAAPGGRHIRSASRHVAAMLVPEPLRPLGAPWAARDVSSVMPGLVPGIHVPPPFRPLPARTAMSQDVDARNKSGHDDMGTDRAACPATERGAGISGAPTSRLCEIWPRTCPGSRVIFFFRSFLTVSGFPSAPPLSCPDLSGGQARLVPPRRNRLH